MPGSLAGPAAGRTGLSPALFLGLLGKAEQSQATSDTERTLQAPWCFSGLQQWPPQLFELAPLPFLTI